MFARSEYEVMEAMAGMAMVVINGAVVIDEKDGLPVVGSEESIARLVEMLNSENG